MARVRYGDFRIHTLLRREGWHVNHRRVYRVYCKAGLNLRIKAPKRRVAAAHCEQRPLVSSFDECWSMDFVFDNLFNGRRIRALTIFDNFKRECLGIYVDRSIKDSDVVHELERLRLFKRHRPQRVQVDQGQEFISKDLDCWACENGVTLDFSRPWKPTDNSLIESFNGSFRDECLNTNWLLSIRDAREKINSWRKVLQERISMCGFIPVTVLLHAALTLGATRGELVGYTYSGAVSGDIDQVVGYAGVVVS